MHQQTLSAVRRIRDDNGEYLFQLHLSDGLEIRLLGYPVVECERESPDWRQTASIAFGDCARGYQVLDSQGIQILRNPYSAKPYVPFYATKPVVGAVSELNAPRLLTSEA